MLKKSAVPKTGNDPGQPIPWQPKNVYLAYFTAYFPSGG
jgi:hypothetical protein